MENWHQSITGKSNFISAAFNKSAEIQISEHMLTCTPADCWVPLAWGRVVVEGVLPHTKTHLCNRHHLFHHLQNQTTRECLHHKSFTAFPGSFINYCLLFHHCNWICYLYKEHFIIINLTHLHTHMCSHFSKFPPRPCRRSLSFKLGSLTRGLEAGGSCSVS